MEYISLNSGARMPQEGFGTFQIPPKDCKRCVRDALSAGYRLIDTASAYGNEESVGAAIRESGIPREELFITTKLWVQDASYEGAKKAVDASLKRLGIDYLDLYLIHQPFGDYYSAWRAMEEMYRNGKVRAIGVCNFDEARLVDLCLNHEIRPAVDQIEIHPFHQQGRTIQIMKKYGVQPQAWGPLVEGQKDVFRNKRLSKIAVRYGKSIAQVILRWHVQRGVMIIPRTVQQAHMEENRDIWDFALNGEDMKAIAAMDLGHSEIINHYSACTAKALNNTKIHE